MLERGETPASQAPDLVQRIGTRLESAHRSSGGQAHGDAPHGDHDDVPALAAAERVGA